jgi:hypothetical protein
MTAAMRPTLITSCAWFAAVGINHVALEVAEGEPALALWRACFGV